MKCLVMMTQYKRNNLKAQLESIYNQTLIPDFVVVFQNENHVNIDDLKEEYKFIHIKSDYNTKYFGRFAACFTFPVDYCCILDDDIIPGPNCIYNYIEQCISLNSIIGGNGRIAVLNTNKSLYQPPDVGIRNDNVLIDFVGHLWCFKKEWLHFMFSIPPFTYDTGEDMHFCFSSKLLGNINSFVCKQTDINDCCDTSMTALSQDNFSSFLYTPQKLRQDVEKYFVEDFDFKFIENN